MSESPLENVSKILQEGELAITCRTWLPGDADLRTRIAAALLGDHCVQGMTAPCDDCRAHALRQADAVIRELPELQPCPFCGLSHNRCDCLRSTDERT